MVADVEVVRDRETSIREYLRDLRDFAGIGETAFLETRPRHGLDARHDAAVVHRAVLVKSFRAS
jgi:hypothetical protein